MNTEFKETVRREAYGHISALALSRKYGVPLGDADAIVDGIIGQIIDVYSRMLSDNSKANSGPKSFDIKIAYREGHQNGVGDGLRSFVHSVSLDSTVADLARQLEVRPDQVWISAPNIGIKQPNPSHKLADGATYLITGVKPDYMKGMQMKI